MIRTAVLGFGKSAKTFHIPFIQQNNQFELSYLVSSQAASDVSRQLPGVAVVPALSDLPVDQVDLLIITTPNWRHFSDAEFGLKNNLHVVLEKPMVLSSDEALALCKLAEQNSVSLVVFQNRRWDGDFLTVRKLLETNQLGQIKNFISRFDRFRPQVTDRWREQNKEGSGITWDLAPHLIDQALVLFGKPLFVLARISKQRSGAVVDDSFEMLLSFETVNVTLASSCFRAGENQRFVVEGEYGTFCKAGLDVQEPRLLQGQIPDDTLGEEAQESWGVFHDEQSPTVVKTEPGCYMRFWQLLANHLTLGQPTPVPLADSLMCIKIIEAAFESSQRACWIPINGQ